VFQQQNQNSNAETDSPDLSRRPSRSKLKSYDKQYKAENKTPGQAELLDPRYLLDQPILTRRKPFEISQSNFILNL